MEAAAKLADGYLKAAARWRLWEIALWLLAIAAYFVFTDRLALLTNMVWLALFALSLDLILGYAGIISLGHAAYLGIGAYAAALLVERGIVAEPVTGLVIAAAIAGVFGLFASFMVLRGTDLTRIMVTLGVALIVAEIFNQMAWLTGGANGLNIIHLKPILGVFEISVLDSRVSYAYSLAVFFCLFVLARQLVKSPFGLSLRAIRANPLRAAATGVPVTWRLIAIYTIAAAYAGAAGALLAQTSQTVSLSVFSFERSADLLLVLIIGGTGYLYGGPIGAVVFTVVQDWIANLTPRYWQFWIGLILVVIVLVDHRRITGLFRNLPPARGKGGPT
jgi:branched-chain amino acid transport system permease protein